MSIAGIKKAEIVSNNLYRITALGDHDIRQDLFRFAVEHQLAVITLQQENSSMETIFQQLTSET